MAEETPAPAEEQFNVIDRSTGQHLGHVSASDVSKLPSHARVATAEENEGVAAQERSGGLGHAVAAWGAAQSRLVTGGLSDHALVGLNRAAYGEQGAQAARQRLQDYQKIHGTAEAIGTATGAIGLAATGGAAAEAGLAARLGGGALARIGAGATAGAVEGAFVSGGQVVSEAAIENKELTAEGIIAAMGPGALIGGALGGAIAGVGAGARAGLNRLRSAVDNPGETAAAALAARAYGDEAADGIGSSLAKTWRKASETAGVGGAEHLEALGRLDAAGRAARRTAIDAPEIIARNTDTAVGGFKKLYRTMQDVGDRFSGTAKRAQIAKKVSKDTADAAMQRSRGEIASVRAELDEMIAEGKGAFGKQGSIKRIKAQAAALEKQLGKMKDPADAMMALDGFKRDLRKTLVPRKQNLQALTGPQRATYDRAWTMYERVRHSLEDRAVWGEAADMQRGINEKWAALFEASDDAEVFKNILKTKPGRFQTQTLDVDEKKLRGLLKNPNDPVSEQTIQGVQSWLERGDDFVRAAKNELDLSPAEVKAIGEFAGELKKVRGAMGDIAHANKLSTQLAEMTSGAQGGQTAAAGLGYMMGSLGPAGAPLMMAANLVTDPARAVRSLAGMEKLFGSQMSKIGRLSARVTKPKNLVRKVAVSSTLEHRERRRMERQRDAVVAAQGADLSGQVQARLTALGGAPNTIDAITAKVIAQQDYLAQHAPMPMRQHTALGGIEIPPPDSELEIFDRRRKAVANPMSVLEDISGGIVTPEAVEALSTVYPELYGEMRVRLQADIVERVAGGHALPEDVALNVAMFLGGAVDPMDAPEVRDAVQAMYAEQETPQDAPPPKKEPPDLSDDIRDDNFLKEL